MTVGSATTHRWRALMPTLAALALVAGCGSSGTAAPTPTPSTASKSPTASPSFEPQRADFRAIQALLTRQAKALRTGSEQAFMRTIDTSQPRFVAQQKVLFHNIAQLPLAALSYGVDPTDALVPAKIPGHDPLLHPTVVEHLQIAGTFGRPVSNAINETFVRRDGHWLLGAESEAKEADHIDTAQERPWYGGPIAVRHVGDMTVMVDQSQAASLSGLSSAVHADIGYDAQLLGVPASYRILVDATSNGLSFDFSSQSTEEAAATTFPVVATDALGEKSTGLAGLVIKVNPHTVKSVVSNQGIIRHELTHYLLTRFGGASPKWLSEGVAAWVQYYPDDFSRYQIPAALYNRLQHTEHALPIIGLFNTDPSANYPISQAAVTWLVDNYGIAKLLDLMRAYASNYAGADVDALTPRLLRQVYAVTPTQVTDGAWRLLAQFVH